VDGTSYAIWAILALEVIGLIWVLILNRIMSTRIESRIEHLKIELAQWVIDQAEGLDLDREPPTAFTMMMPYLKDWLDGAFNPTIEAKLVQPRGEAGQFTAAPK
tara:strand:+ start:306 stop:617 length:312 start_codon:yes stop_codon:yes gene_type:complete